MTDGSRLKVARATAAPKWISDGLSPEQQQVLFRPTPSASILAAAGSGKTRTLVHLVAADLAAGTPPEAIVAFTFTERAAEELLARIHALVRKSMPGIDLSKMYIGTIHAWCLNYLLNQSDFYGITALDELQLEAVVSRLYDHFDLATAYKRPYPFGIEPFLADVEIFYNEHINLDAVPSQIRGTIAKFLETLTSSRLMTFGGMIRSATEHLQRNGPLAELRAVYVDEYQDVNPAQVALVKAMVPPSAKVLGVGDDLQCIYQWRGSDVTRILQFTTEFPGSDVHRLPTNHRSQPSIVSLANAVANDILLRDPEKEMLPGRSGDLDDAVFWVSTESEVAQALKVTEIVKRFMAQGIPSTAIAVLLRSVNSAGGPIVDALKDAKIPVACPTLNRGRQFVDAVLMPVLDWLRKEHPEPKNEVEEKDVEVATAALWSSVRPWVAAVDENTFWGALNEWMDLIDEKKAKAYDVRGRLYDFLNALGIAIRCADHEMLLGLGIASQIIRSVEEIHRRRFPSQPRRTPRGVVSEVYHALRRRQDDFGESSPVEDLSDGVTVCTVHQAKGLEWPIVILPMLKARRFPLSPSPHGTSFPDEVAVRYGTSTDDERRLFYVATTRAKERLFLLDPCSTEPKKRSRFLDDLVAARRLTGPVELDLIPDKVWTLPPKALEKPDPAPLRIGLSELLLYLECPFQFALRRVVGIQPAVGDELGYGKSLHELIQRRLEADKQWTDKELEDQARKHVFLPLMSESGEDSSRAAIIQRLRELERLGLFTSGAETELEIEAVLEDGIVSGIIDVAQVNSDGSLLIRDWKASVHAEFLHRYRWQLGFYAYALRKQGRVVAGADIVDVAESAKQKRIATHAVDVSDGSIGSTLTQLEAGLKGITLGQYPATPSASVCAVCDMRFLCGERAIDAVGHE